MTLTEVEFRERIRKVVCKETSADPDGWDPKNPLWGHCAVISLIAQDYFGGELLRVSLTNVPPYAQLRSHYLNKLTNGVEIDFTTEQFSVPLPRLESELRTRKQVLNYPDTLRRYLILASKFQD